MAKKDSVIFYQEQIQICRKHMDNEQFGRLMAALFELDAGGEPVVDDDIALAYEFMSLQQRIDRAKYEKICERNRTNGQKGGAPKGNQNAKNNPKQPKTTQNNPNDKRMIREENDNENENDSGLSLFGSLSNVELTEREYQNIVDKYEEPDELIDRVSRWLPSAKHNVPDHYEAILNFATKSGWSKKRILKPPPPEREIDPADMPTVEEQAELAANLKRKIGFDVIG